MKNNNILITSILCISAIQINMAWLGHNGILFGMALTSIGSLVGYSFKSGGTDEL